MSIVKPELGVRLFALIEIVIGLFTISTVILSLIQGSSTKPLNVLLFVLAACIISVSLGFGILRHNPLCYYLLLYFSSVIILSKVLIFVGILTLSGALETVIPSTLKNIISVLYHSLLIFYFTRKPVRELYPKT